MIIKTLKSIISSCKLFKLKVQSDRSVTFRRHLVAQQHKQQQQVLRRVFAVDSYYLKLKSVLTFNLLRKILFYYYYTTHTHWETKKAKFLFSQKVIRRNFVFSFKNVCFESVFRRRASGVPPLHGVSRARRHQLLPLLMWIPSKSEKPIFYSTITLVKLKFWYMMWITWAKWCLNLGKYFLRHLRIKSDLIAILDFL